MEFTLLGAALFGVFGLYAMLWWEAKRGNAADCSRSLWDTALTAAIVGLIAGRLAAMVGAGVNPFTNPGDILIVRGGVATGPAALGAVVTLVALGRRELAPLLDGLAPAALAGLAGWHGGCLVRDACLGTPSDLPWALAGPGSTVTRHPVELYAALAYLAAGIGLAWWKKAGRPAPLVPAFTALGVAGLVRLATEPMRPSLAGGPVEWYLAAVAFGAAGAVWAQRRRHREGASSQ